MTVDVNHLISDEFRECGDQAKKDVPCMENLMAIAKPVSHD